MNKIQLEEELNKNPSAILLVRSINYENLIIDIIKQLNNKRTCYITLNKTYNSLKEMLKINNADTKSIIFIDGITKKVNNPEYEEDCYFIDPETMLNEISKNVTDLLNQGCNYLIFDSLTNLFAYNREATVEHFIQNLVNLLEEKNCKGLFISLKETESAGCCSMLEAKSQDSALDIIDSRVAEKMKIIDLDGE